MARFEVPKECLPPPPKTEWAAYLLIPVVLSALVAFAIEALVPWFDFVPSTWYHKVTVTLPKASTREVSGIGVRGSPAPRNRERYSCSYFYTYEGRAYDGKQDFLSYEQHQQCPQQTEGWVDPDQPTTSVIFREITTDMVLSLLFVGTVLGALCGIVWLGREDRRQKDRRDRAQAYPRQYWRWRSEWEGNRVGYTRSSLAAFIVLSVYGLPLLFLGVVVPRSAASFPDWGWLPVAIMAIPCLWVLFKMVRRYWIGLGARAELLVPGGFPLVPGTAREVELVLDTHRPMNRSMTVDASLRWSCQPQKEASPPQVEEFFLVMTPLKDGRLIGRFSLSLPDWEERQTNGRTIRWHLRVTHPGCGAIAELDLPVYRMDELPSAGSV